MDIGKGINRKNTGSIKWKLIESKVPEGQIVAPMSIADLDFNFYSEGREKLLNYIRDAVLGYTQPTNSYYSAIINHYKKKFDMDLGKEDFVLSSGVILALFNAVRAFTKEGDEIAVFTPIYRPFVEAVNLQNRKLVKCPLVNSNNRFQIDFELFDEICKRKNLKLLIFCNPHNPGGRVWSREELEKIDEITRNNGVLVISDEIHGDIMLNDNIHIPYFTISEKSFENSIICTSASKSFNIAGLSTANIFIKNPDLREAFNIEFSKIGFHGPNLVGIKATEIAYSDFDKWNGDLTIKLEQNHRILEEFFQKLEGFSVMKPDATYLSFVNFEGFVKMNEMSVDEFYDFIEKEAFFFPSRGDQFGEDSKYYMRLNIGIDTELLIENFERLKKAVDSVTKK
ncbi:MAG: aminotransferase class I/II-fold pyridoxal phosphate-dependent enzyme [Tissierellia bacterium]|nr:aminotransferase class I/II-fold pyridoxal phosphate-dependent enzyme [Tissierellia bacterium]